MTFHEYQLKTGETAIYPVGFTAAPTSEDPHNIAEASWMYPALLLASEQGEVLGLCQKVMRDSNGCWSPEKLDLLRKEVGDCCWALAQLCTKLGLSFNDCAEGNIRKLADRKARGVLQGSGDER